jgi:hypothetical protein
MTILQTVELLGRVISSSQGLYLNTGQQKHRINTYTPTIPASERAKTVHALDRSATVTGLLNVSLQKETVLHGTPKYSTPPLAPLDS